MYKHVFYSVIVFVFSLQTHAWTVDKLKGEAMISRSGQLIPAEKGLSLVGSDVVQTEAKSRVLLIDGHNKIWLGAKTKFKVGNLDRRKGEQKKTQTLNVLYGKIRSAVKKRTDSKVQYRFKTPTAVAGVRGTEFFIESKESGEFFCTLNGSIEVETNDGSNYIVNEGKGLRLAEGDAPNLSGTSSQLVNKWVSETSFENDLLIPEGIYDNRRRKYQWQNKKLYYGAYASAYYCGSENSDFNDSVSDSNMECYRYTVSPYIQWGKERNFLFRPAVYGTHTNTSGTIDTVPWKTGKDKTAVTVAEAYYEDSFWRWKFRLGLQDVHWTDGALLSTRANSIEPQSHLALRAFGNIGEWEVEFLGGPGLEDDDPLMGHTHIKTLGLKGKLPKDRGELFILHANFDEIGSNPPSYAYQYYGHEILNAGYYINRQRGKWDYVVSYIHQDHGTHHGAGNIRGEAQGTMSDLIFGKQLEFARPTRLSLRWLKASRNYIPVLEDYYTISNSTVFNQRINIEQYRAKLELQVTDSQRVSIEYILNSQVSANGFVTYGSAGKGDELGREMAISHSWRITNHLKWANTFWQINPDSTMGSDSAHGLNSLLSYNF